MGNLSSSAVDRLWNNILAQPRRYEIQTIKATFQKYGYLDSEEMQDKNFTILHRIVLNLSPIDLRAQLETSTADIDLPDLIGYTPFQWASLRSDLRSMKILIEFGASIHLTDYYGYDALYRIASFGTMEAFKVLLAAISSRSYEMSKCRVPITSVAGVASSVDYKIGLLKFCLERRSKYGHTALHGCCGTLRNGRVELARVLLDAGADVDSEFSPSEVPVGPPLAFALQNNRHAIIRLLLERGARIDLFDPEMQGTLHIVAIHGDLTTIEIIEYEDDLNFLSSEDKDIFGFIPLEAFDQMRLQYRVEDERSREECREAFIRLLSKTRDSKWEGSASICEDIFYDAVE